MPRSLSSIEWVKNKDTKPNTWLITDGTYLGKKKVGQYENHMFLEGDKTAGVPTNAMLDTMLESDIQVGQKHVQIFFVGLTESKKGGKPYNKYEIAMGDNSEDFKKDFFTDKKVHFAMGSKQTTTQTYTQSIDDTAKQMPETVEIENDSQQESTEDNW